jgi:hypothetical protein
MACPASLTAFWTLVVQPQPVQLEEPSTDFHLRRAPGRLSLQTAAGAVVAIVLTTTSCVVSGRLAGSA